MQSDQNDSDDDLSAARYRSLSDDLRKLKEEARAFARVEMEYQKARAAYAARAIAGAALFGLVAFVLLWFAMVALVLGAILGLTPALGAWGAMGVVFAVLLVLALLFGGVAAARVKRMVAVIGGEDGPQ